MVFVDNETPHNQQTGNLRVGKKDAADSLPCKLKRSAKGTHGLVVIQEDKENWRIISAK